MLNRIVLMSAWLALGCFAAGHATTKVNDKFKYPFYLGITGGYGATTWEGLVPSKDNQNFAISMSTPQYVTEGGAIWGVVAGYEFVPYFALEAEYVRYPNATVTFDPSSLFTFEHDGLTAYVTHTETVSLMGKIMLIIPSTDIRAYSSLGVAEVHRSGLVNEGWITSPTFGAGFNYNFTDHVMSEFGANYTAGRGESELSPADDYFPFLYSVFLRLAYRL